jgi:catechol-2,3-dioxygenase
VLRAGAALIGHVCAEMKRSDEAGQVFRRVIGFDRLHPAPT